MSSEGTSLLRSMKLEPASERSTKTQEISNASNSGLNNKLLEKRKLFTESGAGRASFRELLEPISFQSLGMAPYQVILGDVKEKLLKTCKGLELLLDDLPYESYLAICMEDFFMSLL